MKKKISITTKKGLFGRKPVDFEDLGKVRSYIKDDDVVILLCSVCHRVLRVGRKKGETFHWCKQCGIPYKINPLTNSR